jgi:hypothetical protein
MVIRGADIVHGIDTLTPAHSTNHDMALPLHPTPQLNSCTLYSPQYPIRLQSDS